MLGHFNDFKQTIQIYLEESTYDESTGESADVDTLIGSYEAIFYKLSAGQRYVYNRIDPLVSAMVILDPFDAPVLSDNMYALIDSVKWYFVNPDNIMDIDEVIQIPVKRGE